MLQADLQHSATEIASLRQKVEAHAAAAGVALVERQEVMSAMVEEEAGKAAAALVGRDAFWKGEIAAQGREGAEAGKRLQQVRQEMQWNSAVAHTRGCLVDHTQRS